MLIKEDFSIMTGLSAALVGTDREVVVQAGNTVVLPCRVDRDVATVSWSKGPDLPTAPVLVLAQFHNGNIIKDGKGYKDKLYDISSNFSLIINKAQIGNNGKYFCEIFDLESGGPISNSTYLTVFGK